MGSGLDPCRDQLRKAGLCTGRRYICIRNEGDNARRCSPGAGSRKPYSARKDPPAIVCVCFELSRTAVTGVAIAKFSVTLENQLQGCRRTAGVAPDSRGEAATSG